MPSFSCSIKDSNFRALKDTRYQQNFILESLADKLNLKVIKSNVEIINIPKQYVTKFVEYNLFVGNKYYLLNALCLPKISLSLAVPQIGKIVKILKGLGYPLADEFLKVSDTEISDFQFILGVHSAFCMPENEILVHSERESVLGVSPSGIVVKGNAVKLLRDLRVLPDYKCFKNKLSMQDAGRRFY